jgi:hypothetical protein
MKIDKFETREQIKELIKESLTNKTIEETLELINNFTNQYSLDIKEIHRLASKKFLTNPLTKETRKFGFLDYALFIIFIFFALVYGFQAVIVCQNFLNVENEFLLILLFVATSILVLIYAIGEFYYTTTSTQNNKTSFVYSKILYNLIKKQN